MTYANTRHPAWLRIWLYAMDHSGHDLQPGQLREATALEPRTLSRALHTARHLGLITSDSHARKVTALIAVEVTRAS